MLLISNYFLVLSLAKRTALSRNDR